MSCSPLQAVLIAACESSGVGLLGAGVLRSLRGSRVAHQLVAVLGTTVAALSVSTVAALLMARPAPDAEVAVLVVFASGAVSIGIGLLLGRSVLLGAGAGDSDGRTSALARQLVAANAELAETKQHRRAAEDSRRQLVSWFAHDLRTPLARLRAIAESAQEGVLVDSSRYLAQVHDEVRRLATLVDDLFELSRIQAGAVTLTPADGALDDFVSDAVAELGDAAAAGGVQLSAGRMEPVVAVVDHKAMARVMRELLTNAIRHGGGAVSIDTWRESGGCAGQRWAVVSITDECGGIPEPDLDSVFKVGWRGGQVREGEGGGLGLAIAHGLVVAQRGEIAVRNSGGGCCFEVRVPLSRPDRAG